VLYISVNGTIIRVDKGDNNKTKRRKKMINKLKAIAERNDDNSKKSDCKNLMKEIIAID
jgi:hypothetical protein